MGIDNEFTKEVNNSLQPGAAALFILAIKATRDKVVAELSQYGGHVARTSLSEEDEAALRQAIEPPEVKAGAEDLTDEEWAQVEAADPEEDDYLDELECLADLHEKGIISDEEFSEKPVLEFTPCWPGSILKY